jgi:ribosomal protein L11 methyltransferase
MPWIEFHIKTTADHTDELERELTLLGAGAITLKDAGDQAIYESSIYESSIHEPSIDEPSIHEPSIHEPGIHESSIHESSIHESSIHEPSIHEPGIHESSIHESSIHESSIHEPSIHEPSIYEPRMTAMRIWAETIMVALFEQDHPTAPVLSYLEKQQREQRVQSFHTHPVEDEDWVRRSLDSFKPLCFGKRLWICPSWHEPPDSNAINVILDPGLAFGTGHHPTTALCLEWLDQQVTSQDLIIDYGCGSGILGIAAHQLGAKKIIAVDNDPEALNAAIKNAQQNNISSLVFTARLPGDIQEAAADIMLSDIVLADIVLADIVLADIVLANILAQPLMTLANTLANLTKPQGHIVLSGILIHQVDEVKKAYEPWFNMHPAVFKEEWACLVGRRL